MSSLRGTLLRGLMAPLLLVVAMAALSAYFVIRRPAESAYDQALSDEALALSLYVRNQGGTLVFDFPSRAEQLLRTDRFDSIYFLIVDEAHRLVAGDPGLPLPPAGARLVDGRLCYDGTYRGRTVRAAALMHGVDGRPVTVVVAETTFKRRQAAWEVTVAMLIPGLILAGGVALLVWRGVARGLGPLESLRAQIQARSLIDLSPVAGGPVVDEVRPLIDEINHLLGRLTLASGAQQRFIADAAHQLRTPLAGLQTQLELALDEADPAAKQQRLVQCRDATRRTARLVGQLLTLSAAEPGGRSETRMERLDLAALLRENANLWVHRAIECDLDLGLELAPAAILGDRLLVGEAAANLVGNALAYSRPGDRITVSCGLADGQPFLAVADTGPGIPPDARPRVLERFYRLPGTPGSGSGLGLAIVAEVARSHGAAVRIDSPAEGSGIVVTLRFQPAATS